MNALMDIHIASGIIALLAGTAAVLARKGGLLHARAGTGFFGAMLVLGLTAALLEPYRTPPGSPVAGVFVCYFVLTGWAAARRRAGTAGWFEIVACVFALGIGAAMMWGGFTGSTTPAGRGPVFILAGLCFLAGLGDLGDPGQAHAGAADRASPVADVLRLVHRDRLLLPRPAGRHAAGGARLAGPVRPRLRAVRGDSLLAHPAAARKAAAAQPGIASRPRRRLTRARFESGGKGGDRRRALKGKSDMASTSASIPTPAPDLKC